jgi:hypothetical protein
VDVLLASLDLGQIVYLIDERQQVFAGPVNRPTELDLFVVEVARARRTCKVWLGARACPRRIVIEARSQGVRAALCLTAATFVAQRENTVRDTSIRPAVLGILTLLGLSLASVATAQGINWNGANYPNNTFPQLLDRHSARDVSAALASHGFQQVRLPFGEALIAKWATTLPADLANQDHWFRRSNGDWVRAYNYGDRTRFPSLQ